jgi:hypothetical protein
MTEKEQLCEQIDTWFRMMLLNQMETEEIADALLEWRKCDALTCSDHLADD